MYWYSTAQVQYGHSTRSFWARYDCIVYCGLLSGKRKGRTTILFEYVLYCTLTENLKWRTVQYT